MIPFEIAAGTVAGRDHRLAGRNNQDGYAVVPRPLVLAAFACDGCGSSPQSEVGARLGARLLAECLGKSLESVGPGVVFDHALLSRHCERARQDLLAHLRVFGRTLGGNFTSVVAEYFLFTAIGVVVTPSSAAIVAAGDGLYAINGSVAQLGPYENNAPPYLGYGLLDADQTDTPTPTLNVEMVMPSVDVQSLLIGTDGALDFWAKANRLVPGTDQPLGPLSQFWERSEFFRNADTLRRRLTVASNDVTHMQDGEIERIPGLLHDDTTLIVLRRKEA